MKRVIFSLVICLTLLAATLPAYADTTYVVKQGETLSQIAGRFGVSVQTLVAVNQLTNPNLIWAGEVLTIPAPGTIVSSAPAATSAPVAVSAIQTTYRVQTGDSLYKISRQFGVSLATEFPFESYHV